MIRTMQRSIDAVFAEAEVARILSKMNYIEAKEKDRRIMECLTHS